MATIDLSKYGITGAVEVIHNPSYEELYKAEVCSKNEGFEVGEETNTGAVSVKTGIFTGRSPKDRYIVKDAESDKNIWWDGNINKPVGIETYNHCKALVQKELSGKKLYVVDTFCGTNKDTRMKVRFIIRTNTDIRLFSIPLASIVPPNTMAQIISHTVFSIPDIPCVLINSFRSVLPASTAVLP